MSTECGTRARDSAPLPRSGAAAGALGEAAALAADVRRAATAGDAGVEAAADQVRAAVNAFVARLKASGAEPQTALVAVKRAARDGLAQAHPLAAPPERRRTLGDAVVRCFVEAYYRAD